MNIQRLPTRTIKIKTSNGLMISSSAPLMCSSYKIALKLFFAFKHPSSLGNDPNRHNNRQMMMDKQKLWIRHSYDNCHIKHVYLIFFVSIHKELTNNHYFIIISSYTCTRTQTVTLKRENRIFLTYYTTRKRNSDLFEVCIFVQLLPDLRLNLNLKLSTRLY